MSRAVKANNYGKEKVIIMILVLLLVGFIVGMLFVLQTDKEKEENKTNNVAAYKCNEGDVLFLGDQLCGDEFGNDTYQPIEVTFDLNEYKKNPSAFNIYNVIPLLLEESKPEGLKNKEYYYIVNDTTFNIEASIDVIQMNDFLGKENN